LKLNSEHHVYEIYKESWKNYRTIIFKKISDLIFVDYIHVYDYTAQHENHATFEGNYHLSMTLVSPDFNEMSLIERHQTCL
jgi:Stress-induced morphogen (activity unknown)